MRKSSQQRPDPAAVAGDTLDGEIRDTVDAGEFADAVAEDAPETVDERVSELQRELTLARDKYLRLAAEFDNYRKRAMKEGAEAQGRGQAALIKLLLDPLDDIARFADLDPSVTECATVVQGVDMVEKKFEKQLRAAGMEVVNPVDEPFDPELHEAVSIEPAASADLDGTVSQVFQVGYTFKGQLLRPARVVVRQHHDSR